MADTEVGNESKLDRARELVAHMESGNEEEAKRVLEELARQNESGLFQELGRLTRQLHEALNNFQLDSRLVQLTENDIPDARERLNRVIAMTEDAAHRTLNAVEGALPVAEELRDRAGGLGERWQRFRDKNLSVEDFRELSREIGEFLSQTGQNAARIHGDLSEVLMAQGFQDLTGQIIRRVITLVKDVEESLVELVRISGQRQQQAGEAGRVVSSAGHGPHVPDVDDASAVVSGQDDVDELLSSLGF